MEFATWRGTMAVVLLFLQLPLHTCAFGFVAPGTTLRTRVIAPRMVAEDSMDALEARMQRLSDAASLAQREESVAKAAFEEAEANIQAAEAAAAAKAAAEAEAAAEAAAAAMAAEAAASSNSSEALFAALEALETDIRADDSANDPTPSDYSSSSALRSETFQQIESLALEARSFVLGVRENLERVQGNAVEKLKVEASVALKIADFVLRRALLDTSRALGAAGTAVLALGAAPAADENSEVSETAAKEAKEAAQAAKESKPFASRVDTIAKQREATQQRSLPGAAPAQLGASGAADEEGGGSADGQQWMAQAAAQREGVEEAAELVKETLVVATDAAAKGAESLLTSFGSSAARAADGLANKRVELSSPDTDSSKGEIKETPLVQREGVEEAAGLVKETLVVATGAAAKGAESLLTSFGSSAARAAEEVANKREDMLGDELPEASSMFERAQKVGAALQDAASSALETTREDYASYERLREAGQLPTLAEEVTDLLPAVPTKADLPPTLALAAEWADKQQLPDLSALPLSLPSAGGSAGGGGVLGSLQLGSDPYQQKEQFRQRREYELALQQLKLVGKLGERAAKDSGDALIFGVLPAASAVGKVAGKRISAALPVAAERLSVALPQAARDLPIGTALPAAAERLSSALPAAATRLSTALPIAAERLAAVLPSTVPLGAALPGAAERVSAALPAAADRLSTALPIAAERFSERLSAALPKGQSSLAQLPPAAAERISSALPAAATRLSTALPIAAERLAAVLPSTVPLGAALPGAAERVSLALPTAADRLSTALPIAAGRLSGALPPTLGESSLGQLLPATPTNLEGRVTPSTPPGPRARAGSVLPEIMLEVAQQAAIEYAASGQRASSLGLLPDVSTVVGGQTQKMAKVVSSLLPSALRPSGMAGGASLPSSTMPLATRQVAPSTTGRVASAIGGAAASGATLAKETIDGLFNRASRSGGGGGGGDALSWSPSEVVGRVVPTQMPTEVEVEVEVEIGASFFGGSDDDEEDVVIMGDAVAFDPNAFEPAVSAGGAGAGEWEADVLDADARASEADVDIDVDVTSSEAIKEESLADAVVAAADLTALAAEVAVDALSQSPALEMAKSFVKDLKGRAPGAEDRARTDEWMRLRALAGEQEKRARMEEARRELTEAGLEAASSVLDRK